MANKWCRLPGGKLFHDVPMQSSLRVTTSDQGVGVEYRCSGLPAGLSSYRLRGAATIPRSVKQAIFRFKPCDMSRYVQSKISSCWNMLKPRLLLQFLKLQQCHNMYPNIS
jgi:hypothetical protein